MIWNGAIDAITVGYLKYCVTWYTSLMNDMVNPENETTV